MFRTDLFTLRVLLEILSAILLTFAGYLLWKRTGFGVVERLASRRSVGIIIAALFPLLARLIVLPWMGQPAPRYHDEYSHLLVADTLVSLRVANPPHPFWKHFETIYVLHQPAYASIYPLGQGFMMALGQWITGQPWMGVWIGVALFCGATCWMLYQWLPPSWALLGGLLAGAVYCGVSSYWINSYWGGAAGGLGGALVFGGLPRLFDKRRARDAFVVAIGWAIVWFVRPYEALLLGVCLGLILSAWLVRSKAVDGRQAARILGAMSGVVVLVALVTAYHNWRVTGSPLVLPYQWSQRLYGVQGTLLQAVAPEVPFRFNNLRDFYWWQRGLREQLGQPDMFVAFTLAKAYQLWDFFINYYFTLPLLLFPWRSAEPQLRLVAGMALAAFLWSTMYPYFFPHYFAPYSGVCLLLVMEGFRRIHGWRWKGQEVGRLAVACLALCATLAGARSLKLPLERPRSQIERQLKGSPGLDLVFVRYGPRHDFQVEWVYNAANIDSAPIVWAREIDRRSDTELVRYFQGRSVWVVEADEQPPILRRYKAEGVL